MSSRPPLILIDASIYIFRYYFSLPERWWSDCGRPTAAVYGYTRWLLQLLQCRYSQTVVACFDESLGSCFRNQLYPEYKASRALPDEALAFQLQMCREVTELLGVPTYASATHEADDLIGTLAVRGRARGLAACILSRDKDLAQLLAPGDCLWDCPDAEPVEYASVAERFGVRPERFADYLALVGDPGDDIPGVPGIGAKTAAALLQAFESVSALLENTWRLGELPIRGAAGVGARLRENEQQLRLYRQLTAICTEAPLERRLQLKARRPELTTVAALGRELGFGPGFDRLLDPLRVEGLTAQPATLLTRSCRAWARSTTG